MLSGAAFASSMHINTAPLLGRRMKEGQAGIYYICTDSKRQAEAAPFTEQLVRKGYEVRPWGVQGVGLQGWSSVCLH